MLSILVVEDDRELRERLCGELRSRGCRVTAARHGVEGLEAIVLDRFDAVVSDVPMLPRGGLWFWREATTLRPELRGRFIFCSANPMPDTGDGPVRTERFVSTPLDSDVLWTEVVAVTAASEAELS